MKTEKLDSKYFQKADQRVDNYRRVNASIKGQSRHGFSQGSYHSMNAVRTLEQNVDGGVQKLRILTAGLLYLVDQGYYADLEEAVNRLDFQKSLAAGNPTAVDKELDLLIEAGELDNFQGRVAQYCHQCQLEYFTFYHFTQEHVKSVIQEEFTVQDFL